MPDAQMIPTHPAELTPAWLTRALRDGGHLRHGSCLAVRSEIVGADRGFSGVVARLSLDYDATGAREEAPRTLIAKFPTARRAEPSGYQTRMERDGDFRRQAFERACREVAFYQTFAPSSPLPVPRFVAAQVDEATGDLVLLIEHIADAWPGDALPGGSVAEARAVVLSVAAFHARWWEAAETLFWRPRLVDPQPRQARFAAVADRFLASSGPSLPNRTVRLIERLRERYGAVLEHLERAPSTLVHADFHLDNVLFTGDRSDPSVVLLDWQTITAGAAVVDVAPFVATSLSVPDRREQELRLLDAYYAALVAGGVTGYTWDQFLVDYRHALLRQLAGVIGWLANTDRSTVAGRERQFLDAALGDGRLLSALEDHRVDQLLA